MEPSTLILFPAYVHFWEFMAEKETTKAWEIAVKKGCWIALPQGVLILGKQCQ